MIAILIIILAFVVISTALSNGNWEVAVLFGGIAVVLLLMGAGERHDVRAYRNWIDHWYNVRPYGTRSRRNVIKTYEQLQDERGLVRVGNCWTAGIVRNEQSTRQCRVCGAKMHEDHRIEYGSGSVYVTYLCGKCRKELPVRIK